MPGIVSCGALRGGLCERLRHFPRQGSADGETWTTIETRTNTAWPVNTIYVNVHMVVKVRSAKYDGHKGSE